MTCNDECRYGVGPHVCFYKIPGAAIGQSQSLPEAEWPPEFELDPEVPGLGVWHACGWQRTSGGSTMKIKTSELTGITLDWAVAKCEDIHITFADGTGPAPKGTPSGQWEMYSTNWSQGGPIIERERIELGSYADQWQATMHLEDGSISKLGPTPLIAAMRCYVASKLGDEVEVPDMLAHS